MGRKPKIQLKDLPKNAHCNKCGRKINPQIEDCIMVLNEKTYKREGFECLDCTTDYDIILHV